MNNRVSYLFIYLFIYFTSSPSRQSVISKIYIGLTKSHIDNCILFKLAWKVKCPNWPDPIIP